ncbi:CPBP family intramembrane glutamic endopeptidase [Spongiimicrobium sp. 3-5]|uniref:CPBP family intramembrane glutamic endopeptidase n=1 Tax=Spongiimicrobium sp. 3-5 TaxID=3332596 RepID=UPI0039811A6B
MYIEQGYKGNAALWIYLILPLGFIGLMVFNYISIQYSPVSTDQIMQDLIAELGSNVVLVLLLGPLAAAFFVVLGWVKLVHSQSIRSLTTSRQSIDWKRILFAFVLWSIITVVLIGTDIFLSPDSYAFNFNLIPFLILAIIAILLIPLQTSFEEYMFRGYMMQGIGLMAKNRWVPLIVTSVLFGLMHLGNPEVEKLGYGVMVYYIGTGFFLGILTLMDEGLELALGFHAANNLIGALLLTSDWTAFQTHSIYKDISEPTLGWDIFVPVLVIYPLLLLVFSKKYGWKNWKDRLTGKVIAEAEMAKLELNDTQLS